MKLTSGFSVVAAIVVVCAWPLSAQTQSIGYDGPVYYSSQSGFENGTLPLQLLGGTTPTFTTISSATTPFSKVALSSSLLEAASDFIPVQTGEAVYGEIWAMRQAGASGSPGQLYCGIARYDKDKNPIAGNLALEYFVASNATVMSDGQWTKYSGSTVLPTSHSPYSGSDGGPVRYVRFYIIVNYSSGTIPTYWGGVLLRRVAPFRDSANLVFNGSVGVGTTNLTHKLVVNGTVRAKELIVDSGWSDYVFAEGYKLAALSDVEAHIKEHQHLPGIPSASEVAEHGISIGDIQAKLLAKIEELTLHIIAQQKLLTEQSIQLTSQAVRLRRLEAQRNRP